MDYVRLRALPAPSTEEHACDVPLNVSKLESAAPDAAEQTPKPIIFDKIPIHRSSCSIKPPKIRCKVFKGQNNIPWCNYRWLYKGSLTFVMYNAFLYYC